ncbi:probable ATP-dependent RNA helicase DDX60 [Xenia sp. Carnegie-2017]|uniref:probable ATP-dependent RNA helicase DDX60 n=1 Tax=Xenia sp. Carnegie-2017 TaxID=2897299 RepID=UPI001F03CA3F|nr:probable ATP-dependent RNA helicase DDX60 [Xenia sp. Carnegie-2017]
MLIDNKEFLVKKDKDNLARYLYGIGFSEIVIKNHLSERSFDFEDKYSLNTPSPRFQLLYLGERLRRETRTDPDNRVNHFIPETWQRDLLDAIDKKQSALIVAPTSSGKTFVSYYCMEKVLREDNEGVVVYVSPTKALVNQVAATCAARYKKDMPPGKSVYGVFTRDYRFNALKCQILITVPQCLEILLLSPDRQDWVDKIRYVVFDEAHCIGLENNAEVWEHLFLLIRCPFLALSATIHNPRDLHSWLQNVEQDKFQRDRSNNTLRKNFPFSYNVALVTHNERYNDLEKFIYVPRLNDETEPKLEHVHPCSALNTRQLKKDSQFPTHVTLSPRETMAFYDAVQEVFPEDDLVRKLSPESYFENETFISKESVRRYENDVKSKFMEFIKKNDERGEEVINKLLPETSLDVSIQDEKYRLVDHIFDLVEKLKNENLLPVIFFSFDRKLCETFAKKIVSCLQKRENQHGGDHDGRKTEKMERKIQKAEKRQRDEDVAGEVLRKTNSAGQKCSSHQRNKTSADATCFLVDNPPPENCSYAGKGVLDAHEANLIVQRLVKRGETSSEREEFFQECLRRGVGYHHAGMNNKERSAVEMLFRKKFVNVVFATGTLALGIHMPCKTVVFAHDSVFLNTLQYHQISGRAGRRGFDMIGNVIFFGIPQAKINRLMTVSLPRIIGNFPLNESLVLRLLLIVNKGKDREVALNQALTLLHNPLICKNQPELDLQLKHHFLFCVEHLVRQGLLDLKGCPQGLAGLAIHLHYHEPSNFVLLSFLRSKVLHNFCRNKNARKRDGKFSKDFMKSLVIVLSHLFARRRLHEFLMQRPRSTSKIRLEKLPSEFEAELDKYNSNVHEVFDLYIRTVSGHVNDTSGEDITLPLSSVKLISAENYKMNLPPISLENKLQSLSVPYKMCSSFAALSGNTDDRLYSSNDRVPNIRYQVYTDVKVVPVFPTDINLNGYVYDFFNHGNYKAIISENGLMHGEAYQLLKDFMLVLKSISVSLEEWAPENDIVRKAFVQLAQDFSSTFKKAFD